MRAAALLWLAAAVASAGTGPDPGTQEMAALLKERTAQVDVGRLMLIANDRRVEVLEAKVRNARNVGELMQARLNYAMELTHAGRLQESIQAYEALEADVKRMAPDKWAQGGASVLVRKAAAYLRLGEEENCHQANNRDSCLMPIKGQGVHQKREGSIKAAETLLQVLEMDPSDLKARWLLNVAHMTLGTYPDGVPKQYLIPPSAFASEYPLPPFTNVAHEAGVDVYGLSGGAIMEDFDNDGRLDLLLSAVGFTDPMHYFWNRGDGTFEDRTEKAGLTGEVGGLNMLQADYDNDGFVDVVVLRGAWMGPDGHFPLSLLHNNGDGTFSDVTIKAGMLRFAPTQTGAWLDYDGDGWLDLFVGNESLPADPSPCHLFHNNHDGTFTDVAKDVGVDVASFVKGVAAGDYDGDGRPDLYLSIGYGQNYLLHNDGPRDGGKGWHFTDVAKQAGVLEPESSFGAFFFDYDNDGRLDLFVAGYGGYGWLSDLSAYVAADFLGLPMKGERGRLYHNRGDGTFEDVTQAMGLYRMAPAMGNNFGDLDNDGWLDIYLGTGNPDFSSLIPNRMFRNDGGKRFQDVTTAGNFGNLQKGHAIAFGDIDNDGDQDIFEEMGGAYFADRAYSTLFANPGNKNHWVTIQLEGVRSNRRGMGARLEVVVETKAGLRSIFRTVGSGGSFGGSPLRQEIGLGDAKAIREVKVFWPVTGETQRVTGLNLDSRYVVKEGEATPRKVVLPAFALAGSAKAAGKSKVSASR